MVGQKKIVPILIEQLKLAGITSFSQTEFLQGNTTRWGVAWTYCDYDLSKMATFHVDPTKISNPKKIKPVFYFFPKNEGQTLEAFYSKLSDLFKELEVSRNIKINIILRVSKALKEYKCYSFEILGYMIWYFLFSVVVQNSTSQYIFVSF